MRTAERGSPRASRGHAAEGVEHLDRDPERVTEAMRDARKAGGAPREPEPGEVRKVSLGAVEGDRANHLFGQVVVKRVRDRPPLGRIPFHRAGASIVEAQLDLSPLRLAIRDLESLGDRSGQVAAPELE